MTPNIDKVWFDISTIILVFACLIFLSICSAITIYKVKTSISLAGRSQLKKTVATTCLLLGVFTICWIPLMSFEIYMYILYQSDTIHLTAADFEL